MESIFLKGLLWIICGLLSVVMMTSLRFTRLMVNTIGLSFLIGGLKNGLSWPFMAMGVFLLFVSVLSFFIADDEEDSE